MLQYFFAFSFFFFLYRHLCYVEIYRMDINSAVVVAILTNILVRTPYSWRKCTFAGSCRYHTEKENSRTEPNSKLSGTPLSEPLQTPAESGQHLPPLLHYHLCGLRDALVTELLLRSPTRVSILCRALKTGLCVLENALFAFCLVPIH